MCDIWRVSTNDEIESREVAAWLSEWRAFGVKRLFGTRYAQRGPADVAEELQRLRDEVSPDRIWFAAEFQQTSTRGESSQQLAADGTPLSRNTPPCIEAIVKFVSACVEGVYGGESVRCLRRREEGWHVRYARRALWRPGG